VRAEGDPEDFAAVTLEGEERLAAGNVPDLDRAIVACRGETLAVRREGKPIDPVVVDILEIVQAPARTQVPHDDVAIPVAGDQVPPVGAESQGGDPFTVTAKSVQLTACARVPYLDLAAEISADHGPGGRGQMLSIRAEGQEIDVAGMWLEVDGAGLAAGPA